jgi:hypothetical protein
VNAVGLTEIIVVIRDIAIIVAMVVSSITILLIFRSVYRLLKTVTRTTDKVSESVFEIGDNWVKPATTGSGAAFVLGKLASIFMGFGSKKEDGDHGDNGGKGNG